VSEDRDRREKYKLEFFSATLVSDPVALAVLLGFPVRGKATFSALKGEGGNAGQPLEPLRALRRERVAADRYQGSGVFRISYLIKRGVGSPGQCVYG
jgi:hypothetical protein